jgi:enolase
MKSTVEGLTARQILDSRGNPTVEVEVWLKGHRPVYTKHSNFVIRTKTAMAGKES